MTSLNDSGIMNGICGNLLEGTGLEVQKTLNLLNHPTVKMEIERLVIQVIAQQYNILERLDVLEQYLGVSAKTHFVDVDFDWEEMDDVEKLMNPEKKRKPLNSLHERLSELEKKVIECNMPTNYENSSLSGNKTEVRAKMVMKELENVKPNLAGKMLTSSEIYQFLSSTTIPEEYRILVKKSSSRGMVQSVMDKVVELYPDKVRKGKKRNGKKTSFLIIKPLDNDY